MVLPFDAEFNSMSILVRTAVEGKTSVVFFTYVLFLFAICTREPYMNVQYYCHITLSINLHCNAVCSKINFIDFLQQCSSIIAKSCVT